MNDDDNYIIPFSIVNEEAKDKNIFNKRGSFISQIPEIIESRENSFNFTGNTSFIKSENINLKIRIAILEEELKNEKNKIKCCVFTIFRAGGHNRIKCES